MGVHLSQRNLHEPAGLPYLSILNHEGQTIQLYIYKTSNKHWTLPPTKDQAQFW